MTLRRAWLIVALLAAAIGPAAAQFQPVAPPAQQQAPPCFVEFSKMRNDTEKKAIAIRTANERKADAKVACGLFNAFTAAEGKMLKYAVDNATWCGIPPQVIEQIKKGHAQAMALRGRICQAAANAANQVAPRAPSLSDALGAPIPDSDNIKTGRGTYDTLTGTPLGNSK
jgi:hypothetical protein